MGAMVLSQEKRNLGEGFEYSINEIMISGDSLLTYDSSEDPERFMGLCDQSHCATSLNVRF